MFKAKCLRVPIKERGIFVCRCQISHSTLNIRSTKVYSDGINVYIQSKLHMQFKSDDFMRSMLKNSCFVFSLKEFEQYALELQGNTFTFNGSAFINDVNLREAEVLESFTIEADILSNLIKTLRDNINILGYKLVNA